MLRFVNKNIINFNDKKIILINNWLDNIIAEKLVTSRNSAYLSQYKAVVCRPEISTKAKLFRKIG